MTPSQPVPRVRSFIVRWTRFFLVFCGVLAMSNLATASTSNIDEVGFGVSGMGGRDYGTNGIGVWLSGKVRVGLSDTVGKDFIGVGVIEARLSPDDLKRAKEIQAQLCQAAADGRKNEVGAVEPAVVYSVDCLQHGKLKTYQGRFQG